ncbi:unnamed protein product [Urochloa decumbens]|uniref:Uncharacterized protein n=1 Tax=Urochloa decumbens TaxID=240449 RepID=A0ABC8YG57_9POAL
MSKPWALQDLMTAVDAGHVAVLDSDKAMAPRHPSYGARGRKLQSSDASFEFSAVVSYSSASPASMVFSEGQLRAHQFPAVRSSVGSSEAASPVRRTASAGGGGGGGAARGTMGSKKRVSFAADKAAAAKAAAAGGGGQGKKSGGLLGCMGSACGSSRNEVVEPARNAAIRKVVAV